MYAVYIAYQTVKTARRSFCTSHGGKPICNQPNHVWWFITVRTFLFNQGIHKWKEVTQQLQQEKGKHWHCLMCQIGGAWEISLVIQTKTTKQQEPREWNNQINETEPVLSFTFARGKYWLQWACGFITVGPKPWIFQLSALALGELPRGGCVMRKHKVWEFPLTYPWEYTDAD